MKTWIVVAGILLALLPVGFFVGEKIYLAGRDAGWWN